MVDDDTTDNEIDDQAVAGWQLALLLLGGFRTLVDQMHDVLAGSGHPRARPAHGFALQAIGAGVGITELAGRLGVSKQAAAKTVDKLVGDGYVTRTPDPADARRSQVVLTGHGRDLLSASSAAFDRVIDDWRMLIGSAAVDDLARALRTVGAATPGARSDLGSWATDG